MLHVVSADRSLEEVSGQQLIEAKRNIVLAKQRV